MRAETIPRLWLGTAAALFVVGMGVCVALGFEARVRLGFAVGGAMALANALAGARRVRKTDFSAKGATAALLMLDSAFRMALLGVGIYVAITAFGVDTLGLVAGLSTAPAGMLLTPVILCVCNRNPGEV
jgi:hypothetical protein